MFAMAGCQNYPGVIECELLVFSLCREVSEWTSQIPRQ